METPVTFNADQRFEINEDKSSSVEGRSFTGGVQCADSIGGAAVNTLNGKLVPVVAVAKEKVNE